MTALRPAAAPERARRRASPLAAVSGNDQNLPLARLFALAVHTLVEPLQVRLAELGFADARPAFAFVLLALQRRPLSGSEVADLLGTSKQAASKLLDTMVARGYIRRTHHGSDARIKLLRITPRGRRCLATAERIQTRLEARWSALLGRRNLTRLRRDLRRVILAANHDHWPALEPIR